MDITLPLLELGTLSFNNSLWIALILGIGFGAFLEQGGMGSALKISGQFYFRDFSVLKIMFSAILTATIGVYWFARFGLLDYDLIFIEDTYIWPQIVGGLLFGAGFAMGGLCPGTSCVAASSGRIDGIVLLLGLFMGIVLFNEVFPLIEGFYRSGALGKSNLPELLNIPHVVALVILVALALAAFFIAERIENRLAS